MFRQNITSSKRDGTLAFSPENPLTRKVTEDAMATVALDNLNGLLALLFNTNMLPQPKGFKNAAEMEKALTQPDAMNGILVGIQFGDHMISKFH